MDGVVLEGDNGARCCSPSYSLLLGLNGDAMKVGDVIRLNQAIDAVVIDRPFVALDPFFLVINEVVANGEIGHVVMPAHRRAVPTISSEATVGEVAHHARTVTACA